MLNAVHDLDALAAQSPAPHSTVSDLVSETLASFGLHDGDAAVRDKSNSALPDVLAIDPDTVGQDLAKLVLTLIEFVRQLLEAQAIRRMDAGSLTEEQEERLGETLYLAREKIIELADAFGIPADELTANLGPLGRLV